MGESASSRESDAGHKECIVRITDVKASVVFGSSLFVLVFEDGCVTVPQRPGLGLELDEVAFARAGDA
jgi:L-alanine-DL-glutamate epimerase-like enolase superfamily enzyme